MVYSGFTLVHARPETSKKQSAQDAVTEAVADAVKRGVAAIIIEDAASDGNKTLPANGILVIAGQVYGPVPLGADGQPTSLPSDALDPAKEAGIVDSGIPTSSESEKPDVTESAPVISDQAKAVLDQSSKPEEDTSTVRDVSDSLAPGRAFNPNEEPSFDWYFATDLPPLDALYKVTRFGDIFEIPKPISDSMGRKASSIVDDVFGIIASCINRTIQLYKQPVDFKTTTIDIEGAKYDIYQEKGTVGELASSVRARNPGLYRALMNRYRARPFVDSGSGLSFNHGDTKVRYMMVTPYQRRRVSENFIPINIESKMLSVNDFVQLYSDLKIQNLSVLPPTQRTNKDIVFGELPHTNREFVLQAVSHGQDLAANLAEAVKLAISNAVVLNFSKNADLHRDISSSLGLNANEPDLQDLPGTVGFTRPDSFIHFLLMMHTLGVGVVRKVRGPRTNDLKSLLADLFYKMLVPVWGQDSVSKDEIDNGMVTDWLPEFTKPVTGGPNRAPLTYVRATFPGDDKELEEVFAGYTHKEQQLHAGTTDVDSLLAAIGDGPVRRIFAMEELPTSNFRGAPPVIAGISTPNTSQFPAQYKAVIDFFEVLSRCNAKTTQQRRLVAALKRLLSSSMADIKGFAESMLSAISQVRALGVSVPDGSFVNNGSIIYDVTDNELLAAVFKGSIHTVRVTPKLIESMVSLRSLVSDLKTMCSLRQWIVHQADYMIGVVRPWLNGTIDISRAQMKERVLSVAQNFNPWLRLSNSSKWWSLIKELDEITIEDCEFIDPLDMVFTDITAGESRDYRHKPRPDEGKSA